MTNNFDEIEDLAVLAYLLLDEEEKTKTTLSKRRMEKKEKQKVNLPLYTKN